MLVDPVRVELAIRQDIDAMRHLLQQKAQALASIGGQIEQLTHQRDVVREDIKRLQEQIAKWESFIAPDPVPGDENTENDTDVCHD